MQANHSQVTRNFGVAPPPTYAIAFIVLMVGIVPFLTTAAMLWLGRLDSDELIRLLPVMVILALVLCLSLLAMKRRSVTLIGHVLEVRAALYRERTPIADIDLERARLVDLAERTELRPLVKTNGMQLPGFHAGRFLLRRKPRKAFCLVTDRHRVLWLPLSSGEGQLLLSVERPQDLLDALRATMDRHTRRA